MSSTPVVSVLMLTYNHSSYLLESIESVLNQKTSFDFELLIFNDNSPDDTDFLVTNIISHHKKGSYIKYFKHPENIGASRNALFALKQAQGKYVGVCEGDDYWIDPLKLQKQVDFLNVNDDYFAVTANTMYLRDGLLKYNYRESKELWLKTKFPENLTYKDIAMRIAPHTTSWLYRNEIRVFPDSYLNFYVGDIPLFLMIAHYGKVKYVDEIVSVYRIHDFGAIGELKKNNVIANLSRHFDMLVSLNVFFKKKYTKVTEQVLFVEAERFLKENTLIKNIEEVKKLLNLYLVKLDRNELTKFEEFKLFISYITAKSIVLMTILKTILRKYISKK